MAFQRKRLFIDNLPDNFTNLDLEKKFNDYGSVFSVEIKQRKNATDNQTPQFAYIHIDIDPNSLNSCLEDFYKREWNGHWITVQEAKESFLDRLKREREAVKVNGHATASEEPQTEFQQPRKRRKEEVTSVELKPNCNRKEVNLVEAKQNLHVEEVNSIDDEYIIKKNNKNKTLKGNLKIESFGKEPVAIIKKVQKKPSVQNEDDRKRLQSLVNMKKDHQQKQLIIKNALSKVDGVRNNKITFDDSDYEQNDVSQNKVALFENDESDGDDYNFEVREQYEGKKGQKLLELQSKFKNDKRFVMDSRFLDQESDQEDNKEEEMTMENEKLKEFEILEGVLGQKVNKSSINKHKMMVRFDPSAPQHAKYEIKGRTPGESPRKKKKTETVPKLLTDKEEVIPEVSKDTFYKIAVDFQEVLKEKQQFSLASMFDQQLETLGGSESEVELETDQPVKKTKEKYKEKNPFKYDSSDDEDETQTMETPATVTSTTQNKVWNEPFFFSENDYRFDEVYDFVQKLKARDSTDFSQTRRNLKEIVQSKIKNHEKKNRPFQTKLGGKKRFRITRKKGLKR